MADLSRTLLVEVGGTNTRCALGEGRLHDICLFVNSDYVDLAAILSKYYSKLEGTRPKKALIAVAAPVETTKVHLTNLEWTIDGEELKQRFGLQKITLVNDFAALACAVPFLQHGDLVPIQKGQVSTQTGNIAVIGPGTGLGTSGLVYDQGGWIPISGEGGHVTLAASDEREAKIISGLREHYGHVSAERVVSGPGLLALYNILSDGPDASSPEDVSTRAAKGDAAANQALDLFFRFLGTVSADLVLTLDARGGLYLAGGILPAIRESLLQSRFLQRFSEKGRYANYLSNIPVFLIVAKTPALEGLNRYARIRSTTVE
ncbi:MAG: glucokinase [Arenicellales bacterium]|nr:glucokinase [Arenicellales bacterium]